MIRKTCALVAMVVLAAGCSGSSGGGGKTAPATSDTPKRPISSAATPAGPTSAQFASIVAKDEVGVKKAAAALAQCGGQFDFDHTGPLICGIGWQTESLTVETLRIELEGAVTPSAGGYLGAPPAEIASLIDDTLAAATAMKTAQAHLERACVDRPSRSACETASFEWTSAEGDVMREIGAWTPYTH